MSVACSEDKNRATEVLKVQMVHKMFEDGILYQLWPDNSKFWIAVQNKTEFLKALHYAYNARWGTVLEVVQSWVLGTKWWVLRSTGNMELKWFQSNMVITVTSAEFCNRRFWPWVILFQLCLWVHAEVQAGVRKEQEALGQPALAALSSYVGGEHSLHLLDRFFIWVR